MGQNKAFVDFEESQEATAQAIVRAMQRSGLSQEKQEEICDLLDEELDKIGFISMEVGGGNDFVFEGNNSDKVKSLMFIKE